MEPVEEERYERVDRQVVPQDPVQPETVQPRREEHYERTTVVRTYDPRIERVIWFVVALVSALLAIRFLMKLLGASYQSDFVRFLYGVTGPLVAPFHGIFQSSGSGNYILEPESLIAIAIYALIGWAAVALLRILSTPRGRPV